MPIARTARTRGFSLVELLVALTFISILMAGMLRVFGSTMNAFSSANEAMGANRVKRWAITHIEDDLQSVGYFYYHPFRTLPGYVSVNTASGQNALMILPDQSITCASYDPATASRANETIWFDELQYLEDQPLPIQAQLASIPTSSTSLSLRIASGSLSDVLPGDIVILLDPLYEICKVLTVGTSSITLDTSASALQNPSDGSGTGASPGLKSLAHQPGTDVVFVRPLQVVRYTVLPLSLDPADPAAQVPCLVRDQAPYPADGNRLAWPAANAALPNGFTRTVVAENVAGRSLAGAHPTAAGEYAFRVDLSPDNGTTWTRSGAATWPAIATNLNTWLAVNGRPEFQSVTDAANPIWYRNIPALFRVDVSTRTTLKRQDPNNPAQRVYTYRSQTLLCMPRNFTYGL